MPADFIVDLLPSGSLSVRFPYDPRAVEIVKTVPGRRWYPNEKYWSIPRTSLRTFRDTAVRQNIGVVLSERVKQAFALGVERKSELEAAKSDTSPIDLPTPTQAYPYQFAGIRFAKHALHNFHGALIADDMGLGKTFQALAVLALHEKVREVLVLCPATLKYVWASEIETHFPQISYTVIGDYVPAARGGRRAPTPQERALQWQEPTRVKIANYDLLLRDMAPRAQSWDLVIADECTFLKTYNAKRTKRAKALRRRYTLALSGIPLENRLEELHSVMDFVIPGLLGPGWLFLEEHGVRNGWGQVIGYRGIEKVRQRIGPYYIRRRKAEVLKELPDKTYSDVSLELSKEEWALYAGISAQIKNTIEENDKLTVTNILVMLLRLKQVLADARLLDVDGVPSTKVAALRDLVEEAGGEHQIVVFTQFAQFARLLAAEFGAPLIEGDVSMPDRQRIVEEFQAGQHPVLISTDAGAYGITLTAADIVVHMDQPWNPAKLRQREDRLHRIGQRNAVQVVSMIARRTVDEKVRGILHRKLVLIAAVLNEELPELQGANISKADLMEMLENSA